MTNKKTSFDKNPKTRNSCQIALGKSFQIEMKMQIKFEWIIGKNMAQH